MMVAGSLSRPAVLEILQELIRTPSVKPGPSPDEAHGEEAIAKVAQNWLTANGVKSWLEEAADGRPNAVAEVGTQRLPRNIGRKAAIELILTGRTFDAAEAERLGLVNRVVPSAQLLDEALALANLLASKASLTMAAALGAIHRGMDAAIDDGLAIEEAAFARIFLRSESRISWGDDPPPWRTQLIPECSGQLRDI